MHPVIMQDVDHEYKQEAKKLLDTIDEDRHRRRRTYEDRHGRR